MNSKDIALLAVFGSLSVLPLLLTNVFDLVVLSHVPGTNGIYVHFLTSLILWVGIGLVRKPGAAIIISTLSSMIAVIVPGGPGIIKFVLIPFNVIIGLVIDILLRLRLNVLNRFVAGFFGVARSLQVLVVQVFFGFPILIGLLVVIPVCVSGAIGANVGVQILKRLNSSGIPLPKEENIRK